MKVHMRHASVGSEPTPQQVVYATKKRSLTKARSLSCTKDLFVSSKTS